MPFAKEPWDDGPERPMEYSDSKKDPGNEKALNPPPAYSHQPPPAGIRIPCSTNQPFPEFSICGIPPFKDLNGEPVYVASCIRSNIHVKLRRIYPESFACPTAFVLIKIGEGSERKQGAESGHQGRYDILPITDGMEWVPAARGEVPTNRRPVEGGYEEMGQHLFHAAAYIHGIKMPGKAGQHLGGARFPWNGQEYSLNENYEILCWR